MATTAKNPLRRAIFLSLTLPPDSVSTIKQREIERKLPYGQKEVV
jgi:hypothetical protein